MPQSIRGDCKLGEVIPVLIALYACEPAVDWLSALDPDMPGYEAWLLASHDYRHWLAGRLATEHNWPYLKHHRANLAELARLRDVAIKGHMDRWLQEDETAYMHHSGTDRAQMRNLATAKREDAIARTWDAYHAGRDAEQMRWARSLSTAEVYKDLLLLLKGTVAWQEKGPRSGPRRAAARHSRSGKE